MKTFLKFLKWFGIILSVLILILVVSVYSMAGRKYEGPYPDIHASADSAIIARGKYLVYGPMHCAICHVSLDKIPKIEAGEELPLVGGWQLDIPPGVFRSRNLTPDPETGIGKLSDGDIARTLRHGIGSDGRPIFPFMPYQNTSDEDMTAIISYLRSQAPVKNPIQHTEYTFLGKALVGFGLIKPEGPKKTPPKTVIRDSSIAYGQYLANSVANCVGCHTNRDLMTGAFIGEPFAGGLVMPPDTMSKFVSYVTPNLTPDPETGHIVDWSEQQFIDRFRKGRVYEGSHMPWGPFSRIDEVDLKALYRYLQSLTPVKNKIDKIVYKPGEKLPG